MKKVITIAAIVFASTAAQADLGTLMKIQAGVALGKQVLDAGKQVQPAQPTQTEQGVQPVRTQPTKIEPGSVEDACRRTIHDEELAMIDAVSKEQRVKELEVRAHGQNLKNKLTGENQYVSRRTAKTIEEANADFDKSIEKVSRTKLTRERICTGLLN